MMNGLDWIELPACRSRSYRKTHRIIERDGRVFQEDTVLGQHSEHFYHLSTIDELSTPNCESVRINLTFDNRSEKLREWPSSKNLITRNTPNRQMDVPPLAS
jgi:hypothetical protein